MLKTLARKHDSSASKVAAKHKANIHGKPAEQLTQSCQRILLA